MKSSLLVYRVDYLDHQEIIKKSIYLPFNFEIAFHSSFSCLFFLFIYETELSVIESKGNYHKSQ